jgi:hypothetical protein
LGTRRKNQQDKGQRTEKERKRQERSQGGSQGESQTGKTVKKGRDLRLQPAHSAVAPAKGKEKINNPKQKGAPGPTHRISNRDSMSGTPEKRRRRKGKTEKEEERKGDKEKN